jgi:hypothetical protein
MHQLNLKVTDTTESYPAKPESCVHMGHMGKTFILVTEVSPVNKRDLGTLTGKRFGSYERSVTGILFSYQGEISLVNLSKSFLANWDNFCPYEQAKIESRSFSTASLL